MRRLIVSLSLVVAACSPTPAVTTDVPAPEASQLAGLRDQIHAATGHDPEACTSMVGETATIAIDDATAIPDCIIVQESTRLVVSNNSSVDQRFAVSDPPNLNVRHDIYVLEIPSGDEGSIPQVGDRTDSGVYPFYIRGGEPFSGFLVVVP